MKDEVRIVTFADEFPVRELCGIAMPMEFHLEQISTEITPYTTTTAEQELMVYFSSILMV